MKRLAIAVAATLALAGCTSTQSYNSVATVCQTYAVALTTATALNSAGKLSLATQAKINATIDPARTVCGGTVPTTDAAAVQKVADGIVAVLTAQKEAQ